MANSLVIVESPAKVKTIKKFLGSTYEVDASNGHVRDLPKSQLGIDVENDYEPKYITIRGKGDILAKLRKEVKKADKIYLATDPDREGEAISWHLMKALKLDEVKDKKVYRISFNEITKNAVKASLKAPRDIDMNLVDAQQTRRILDRIVGYKISPILWEKVKRGLSAGRVQSAALRMICDREEEISAFIPEEYWNLACDIAVESLIDGIHKPCVHLPMSPVRAEFYGRLRKKIKVLNAESIYHTMQEMELSEIEYERLCREFCRDDHSRWEKEDEKKSPNPNRNRKNDWDDKREKMQAEMEAFSNEAADDSKELMDQLAVENRERYDYRKFLQKFSVLKETVQIDPDAFDYVFYNYGMQLYGNMPLIEPLETKEVRRIEDFVVVIDTSMSCSGELVKKFLEETYGVLAQSESFFKKVNIHILQCDDKVRQDVKIESEEDLRNYMDHMELHGMGGTDFRPAFLHVDQMIKAGKFSRLRGLLYFTDGYGTFPVKMPPYDTAFVFMRDNYTDADVPPWAMKVILDPESMEDVGKILDGK